MMIDFGCLDDDLDVQRQTAALHVTVAPMLSIKGEHDCNNDLTFDSARWCPKYGWRGHYDPCETEN